MSLFPMFVKLAGRPCLVVGAGSVGQAKIEGLLSAGARVRVVAPEATAKIREWARTRQICWEAREHHVLRESLPRTRCSLYSHAHATVAKATITS